jgi:hypothetical protein
VVVAWGRLQPELVQTPGCDGASVVRGRHTDPSFLESLPGNCYLYCDGTPTILFTENETNNERLFGGQNASPYVKDGINNYIVNGQQAATNPTNIGTKASPVYPMTIGPGQTGAVRLRLTLSEPSPSFRPFADFDQILADRLREAVEFHDSITPAKLYTWEQKEQPPGRLGALTKAKVEFRAGIRDSPSDEDTGCKNEAAYSVLNRPLSERRRLSSWALLQDRLFHPRREHPAAGCLQRSRHFMVEAICSGIRGDRDALFSLAVNRLAAGGLQLPGRSVDLLLPPT